jgi:hypothetical protein
MGERVFVRTTPVEPVEPDTAGPRIDYAKPDVNPHFPTVHKVLAWVHYAIDVLYQTYHPLAVLGIQQLGGRRQVVFALGMMFAVGGFGAAIARDGLPVLFMCIGGGLMGLMIPINTRPSRKG